jgi:uncharacterized membrane protein
VLALLLSAFPDLSAERQEAALESTSVDFDPPGPDNSFGYGRVDALAAYQWAATAPDFTVSATPSSVSTPAGGTATYTVTVGSANGFAGNVSLSLSGLSASQASWSFAPPTVAGADGTSQLTVNTSSTLAPGTYQLTIAGTDGTTTHRSSVSLVVPAPPDFSLSASPSSASTLPGGSASFTVTVGSLNGFAGDVALSLAGIPSPPASWSFSPSTVAGGAGTSQLTVSTAASTSPGSYTLTITGTSGGTTHTATATLVVTAPADFTVSASPASASTGRGGTVNYAITVGSVNGFAGNVSLSLSGLQSGQASWTFTPGTVSGGAGTSSLSVTASSTLAAGTYPLTIRGTSGALSHTATVDLVVSATPDFGVSLSPSTLTVIAGQQGSYTVSVSSQGGFTGTVSLSSRVCPRSRPAASRATRSRLPAPRR